MRAVFAAVVVGCGRLGAVCVRFGAQIEFVGVVAHDFRGYI